MGRILIVDDQLESCRPLAVLMRHLGHKGDFATNGQAALEYVRKHPPDLMILDVMMPGMDGIEVLTQLRRDAANRNMPVVMFTALDEDVVRERAMDLGAADYWVKASMDFDQLTTRLELLLDKTSPELGDRKSDCPTPFSSKLQAD